MSDQKTADFPIRKISRFYLVELTFTSMKRFGILLTSPTLPAPLLAPLLAGHAANQ
jgi:hypothetical protein